MEQEDKVSDKTDQQFVDELVRDWEKYGPKSGAPIPVVELFPEQYQHLLRIAKKYMKYREVVEDRCKSYEAMCDTDGAGNAGKWLFSRLKEISNG